MPWIVAADSVTLRVESVAMTRLALCVAVPGAEADLNRMQAEWARTLLGIPGYPQGTWSYLICEVGFQYRLGTCIMCEAIMLETRLLLLPEALPVYRLLLLARQSDLPNWANQVCEVRRKLNNMPDVLSVLGDGITEDLRKSADARRKLAKQYRINVLLPVLREYDYNALLTATKKSLHCGSTFFLIAYCIFTFDALMGTIMLIDR